MRRAPRRWRSPFGQFVAQFKVDRLVSALQGRGVPVTRSAVYQWISGRTRPRPEATRAMLSMAGGRLRYEDVYGQWHGRAPKGPEAP